MNACADGLNYYLHTHPQVKPRVITRFEPWMALTLQRGQHRRRHRDASRWPARGVLRQGPAAAWPADADDRGRPAEPTGSNGIAIAPANTASGHALLLINPHTSFFFRAEAQMVSDEGLNAYGAADLGPVLHLPGLQRARGVDAHLERRRQHRRVSRDDREEGRRPLLPLRHRGTAAEGEPDHGPVQDRHRHGRRRRSRSTAPITGRSSARPTASG